MSWASKLLETYDICQSEVDNEIKAGMLLPLSHLTTKAQIEVVLDENGKFIHAIEIPNDEAVTVIPVTEDSATRGNGVIPHPLHDKLIYISKNYAKYTDKKNKTKLYDKQKHVINGNCILTVPTCSSPE